MDTAPVYNVKRVPDRYLAEQCLRCEYRASYRMVLDIPYCYYSGRTCTDPKRKPKCDLFQPKHAIQLNLFK